jgi:hypothetical protein
MFPLDIVRVLSAVLIASGDEHTFMSLASTCKDYANSMDWKALRALRFRLAQRLSHILKACAYTDLKATIVSNTRSHTGLLNYVVMYPGTICIVYAGKMLTVSRYSNENIPKLVYEFVSTTGCASETAIQDLLALLSPDAKIRGPSAAEMRTVLSQALADELLSEELAAELLVDGRLVAE